MATTNFLPSKNGFHFQNNFVNNIIQGVITTPGRCGGMAFASLDYYAKSMPVPTCDTADFGSSGVPPDGTQLADYIYQRLFDSFSLYGASFIRWNGASDHQTLLGGKGIVAAAKQDEWPKLKAYLDGGTPIALGLLTTLTGGLGDCHQVVAYDYVVGPNFITVSIYDNNHPDQDNVTISSTIDDTNPHWNEANGSGEIWRAFFVEDGQPTVDYAGLMISAPAPGAGLPPFVDIVMTTSVDPSSGTPFEGQAFSCGFSVKNNGPYPAHAKFLYLLASGGPGSAQFAGVLGADSTSPLNLQPGQSYSMLKQTANLNVPVGLYIVEGGYYNNPISAVAGPNGDPQWIEAPTLPGVSGSASVDVLQGRFIINKLNGNCISISGMSTGAGAGLVSWPQKQIENSDQIWESIPDPAGSGYFFLKTLFDGNCISISGMSTGAGAGLVSWPQKQTGNSDQLWQFTPDPAGSGYFFLKTLLDGNCISISGMSTEQGAGLVSWPKKATDNDDQLWKFVPTPAP